MPSIEMETLIQDDDDAAAEHGILSLHRQPPGYQSFAEIQDYQVFMTTDQKVERPWLPYLNDLDAFFEKIYRYYQASGFFCILLGHVLELLEIAFVAFTTFFLIHGVNYAVLFKNAAPEGQKDIPAKVTIADCLIPLSQAQISSYEIVLIVFTAAFWCIKVVQAIISLMDNYAIRAFYQEILQIHDPSLYSWQEVQTRLVRNQSQCLIREGHLDELAIHNRLLRRSNYMIALINKGLLPIYFKLPFVGETIYLTKGLEFNFELLLFRGFLSLFEKNWKLHDDVKSAAARYECAQRFANRCLLLAVFNIVLLPFIFCWQALYAIYTYVEAIKRDPGFASARTWSRYGRWFCKHINELEHELDQRLNRAHRPATRYMNQFMTPWLEVLARFFTTIAGTLLSVIIVLTIYDEDVITVEHILTLATALGAVIAISRAFMPDNEPNRWSFAELDSAVIQHIHYRPHGYPAHTIQARTGMSTIFVYKSTTILEELLSPLFTPFILMRHLRPRALDIIDFFRVYTLELTDIGDVCSFSQFNFEQNGNRILTELVTSKEPKDKDPDDDAILDVGSTKPSAEVLGDQRYTTRNGKLELSLINFKLMNPSWKPHDINQSEFIERFMKQSRMDSSSVAVLDPNGQADVANSRSTIDFDVPGTSWLGHPGFANDPRTNQQSSQQRSAIVANSRSQYRPSRDERNTTMNGFEQSRRRMLQQSRISNSAISEQEERDQSMALSSLFFHELAVSHSGEPESSSSKISESIPLLRRS